MLVAALGVFTERPAQRELARGLGVAAVTRRWPIERFLHLFDVYDDRHARLSTYSKGTRQKILIAAALLDDPAIVILDEPSSGLDVGARSRGQGGLRAGAPER